jgi:hypothetical protein
MRGNRHGVVAARVLMPGTWVTHRSSSIAFERRRGFVT